MSSRRKESATHAGSRSRNLSPHASLELQVLDSMDDEDFSFIGEMHSDVNARSFVEPLNRGLDWKLLAADFTAAAASAALVAPAITIIDRSIVQNTVGRGSLFKVLSSQFKTALSRPSRLIASRPFGIVWALYVSTYTIANGADTLTRHFNATTAGSLTFIATTLVNIPMGVWKDIRFTQLYGMNTPTQGPSTALTKLRIPTATMTSFLFRDGLTIFFSFTLARSLASNIPDTWVQDSHMKNFLIQMTVPVFSQVFATPAHLLGLDFYNNRRQIGLLQRLGNIRYDLPSVTAVRCMRIIPAFGFGCLANSEIRTSLHDHIKVE